MFDIVLLSGFFFETVKIAEPLGICFLASELRKNGFSVKVVEPSVEGWSIKETVDALKKIPCRILGISVQLDSDVTNTVRLVDCLKETGYKSFICVGGHAPSIGVQTNTIYKKLGSIIDCFVIGEGEITFAHLAEQVLQNKSWKDLPGIAFLDGESWMFNAPPAKIRNLDEVSFMARDIYEQYLDKYSKAIPASILFSRGCAYNQCTYCTVSSFDKLQMGPCYRQRSIKNIVEEIKYLHDKYGTIEFNFEDDNFILPGKEGINRINDFCNLVSQLNFKIKFTFFCRADSIDVELFSKLRQAGLSGVYLGIESFNDGTLKFFHKGLTYNHMVKALDALMSLGYSTEVGSELRVLVGYITWHPMTSLEELKQTSKFIQLYRMPPKLLSRKLMLFTGSKIWSDLRKEGLLNSNQIYGWEYKFSEMNIIEPLVCNFIKIVSKTRDAIRTIEKTVNQFKIDLDIEIFKLYRKELDNMCYAYFDNIISICKKNGTSSIYEYDNEMKNNFTAYLESNNIDKKIKYAFKLLNFKDEAVDLFRK